MGEIWWVELPSSEACMSMRVAGKRRGVQLVGEEYPVVQLYNEDGTPYSFPILPGEAGLYYDWGRNAYYIPSSHLRDS